MDEKIKHHISQVEADNNIDIVGCWEVGSKAWGFSNKNSDHDLRMVFLEDTKNYIFNYNIEESITYEERDVEILGWDIKKFYDMLCSSNPSALEALMSPINHRKLEKQEDLNMHISNHFNVIELWIGYQN